MYVAHVFGWESWDAKEELGVHWDDLYIETRHFCNGNSQDSQELRVGHSEMTLECQWVPVGPSSFVFPSFFYREHVGGVVGPE